MNHPDDPEVWIGDLLSEASFSENASAFDLADFFYAEGRQPNDPVALLSQAINVLIAERRRYILRELERGNVCQS